MTDGKKIVGSPQCPKCYYDVLPDNLSVNYEYDYIYASEYEISMNAPSRKYVTGITRTHNCGHIFYGSEKMVWVTA